MWYQTVTYAPLYTYYYVNHLESMDGINWNNIPDIHIFPTSTGFGSKGDAASPTVVKTDIDFKMWFGASDVNNVWSIGYAYSSDGITDWTSYINNPVMVKDRSWETPNIGSPFVSYDGTYHMWYSTNSFNQNTAIGYAESTDGISWTKSG